MHPPGTDDDWPDLTALIRHIVSEHHGYTRKALASIAVSVEEAIARDGRAHPELTAVKQAVELLRDDMNAHITKEENILFPFIEELAASARSGAPLRGSPFGTVLHPIRVMEADHHDAIGLVDHIRDLTKGYALPDGASAALGSCYAELARFEADLRRHIHLEDDVLFPKALELEQQLT